MALFQGLLLITIALGVLAMTYRSLGRGWLPCGSNGFRGRFEVHRSAHPVAYWVLFGAYTLFALWVLNSGVGILFGRVHPLPLS